MKYYIDTNIFLYSGNPKDPHYLVCKNVLRLIGQEKISTLTSTLTLEEIIFYSQKSAQLKTGLKICSLLLKNPIAILAFDENIVKIFLKLVRKYPQIRAADLIHAATCIFRKIKIIISIDQDFNKIKEIKRVDPKEFTDVN